MMGRLRGIGLAGGLVGLLLMGCSLPVSPSFRGSWQGIEDYPDGYTDYFTRLEVQDQQGILTGHSYNCRADFSQCTLNGPLTGTRTGDEVILSYSFDPRNTTSMVLRYYYGGWEGQTYTPFRDKTIQQGTVRLDPAPEPVQASPTRGRTTLPQLAAGVSRGEGN